MYGDKYGTPTDSSNFVLPDFRGRTLWGSEDGSSGYIEADLPNITGTLDALAAISGAFYRQYNSYGYGRGSYQLHRVDFKASKSNPIYNDDVDTVQPASIKIRVKTRYQ